MKSNKGIITILAHLSEFILQNRMDLKPSSLQHLEALEQEIMLLKSQLLPSTEILHFLIEKPSYEVRPKLLNRLKTLELEDITLEICFTVTDKITSVTHLAELWKMAVRKDQQQQVPPDCTAHELLFLLQRVLKQLLPGEFLSDLSRNKEGTRKIIIDFHISIAGEPKPKFQHFSSMGKMWANQARLDSSRSLVLECFSNRYLPPLVNLPKKYPYQFLGGRAKPKNPSTQTREDSTQLQNSDRESLRHRLSSQDIQPLFEIYDSDLDLTIISSDSEDLNPGRNISEIILQDREEIEEFQLLIEEKNKDNEFLKDNQLIFASWQRSLSTIFS